MGKKKVIETSNPVYVMEVYSQEAVNAVMEKIKETGENGFDNLDELRNWICSHLGTQGLKLWMAFDGDDIRAIILVSKVYSIYGAEAFIDYAWADPKYPAASKETLATVERWMTKVGLTKVSATVRRGMNAFVKTHGFTIESYTISKKINQEETHERTVQVEGSKPTAG